MNLVPRKTDLFWVDPFNEMERIHRDLDSFLGLTLSGKRVDSGRALSQSWVPAVDYYETENEFVVKADLPGMDKQDIDVSVQDGVLAIKAEKKDEAQTKKKGNVRTERFYGRYYREVALPQGADTAGIQAQYKNGVLELTLPKKEEAKAKQIKVDIK